MPRVDARDRRGRMELTDSTARSPATIGGCRQRVPPERKSTTIPKIHAYLRVSSPRQVASGLSLDQQKHQLKRYIDFLLESDGYTHLERGEFLVEEGVSASKVPLLLRPEGMKLRTILEPGDHVCFSKPDRCFRSVSDLVSTVKHWEPHNIAMHFETLRIDTSTPHGAMILQIMISVAEWEAAVNRERVMDAIEARKRDKYAIQFGACPIGYKRVRRTARGSNKCARTPCASCGGSPSSATRKALSTARSRICSRSIWPSGKTESRSPKSASASGASLIGKGCEPGTFATRSTATKSNSTSLNSVRENIPTAGRPNGPAEPSGSW